MRYLIYSILLATLFAGAAAQAGWNEGVVAFKTKNYALAAEEFQKVVNERPDGYQGHYMLGLSLQRISAEDKALVHLRKAYDLNPNDNNIRLALATSLHKASAFDEIALLLADVDGASLHTNMQATLYQLRANARSRTGDKGGAVDDYRALVAIAPENAGYQYAYAASALAVDDLTVAINAADAAVSLQPENSKYHSFLARVLMRKARTTDIKTDKKESYLRAAEHAASLVAIEPNYDNLILLVSAQLGAGQYAEAAANAQRAINLKDNDWLAHYYLGQALSSDEKHLDATTPLNTALQLARREQDKSAVWRQLGYVYEKQKLYADAIAAYENAPDPDSVARVRKSWEIERDNAEVEAEIEKIRALEKEAEELEKIIEELERRND